MIQQSITKKIKGKRKKFAREDKNVKKEPKQKSQKTKINDAIRIVTRFQLKNLFFAHVRKVM